MPLHIRINPVSYTHLDVYKRQQYLCMTKKEGLEMKQLKKNGYIRAFQTAFPFTIPVMTGYLFIGIAFGVMYQEKGYNFLWAILMLSLIHISHFYFRSVSILQMMEEKFYMYKETNLYSRSRSVQKGSESLQIHYLYYCLLYTSIKCICSRSIVDRSIFWYCQGRRYRNSDHLCKRCEQYRCYSRYEYNV